MTTETTPQRAAFNPTAFSIETNIPLRPNNVEQLHKNAEIRRVLTLLHTSQSNANKRETSPGIIHESNFGNSETIIHFVRRDAIRIVSVHADTHDMLRSIDVNVGILLHNDPDHQPSDEDMEVAQSAVIDLISPLLMHPQHVQFLIPGLRMVENPCKVISWSRMEGIVILPHVSLSCLHRLDQLYWPGLTKVTKSHMQVGTPEAGCSTRFEKIRGLSRSATIGDMSKDSVLVRITLDEEYIHECFKWSDCSPYDGLTGAKRMDIARAFACYASRLRGYFLPVPHGSPEEGALDKTARLVAVAFRMNRSMGPELMAIANEVFASSNISRGELRRAVTSEAAKLKRIPIAKLFTPDVFAPPKNWPARAVDYPIHPLVAAMRSTAPTSLVV